MFLPAALWARIPICPPRADATRRAAAGFTLLELAVVLTVLGLLAGVVGARLFMRQGHATTAGIRSQLELLAKSLEQYRFDNGHYPSTEQGLAALVLPPASAPRWQGPYLSRAVPADPWGRPYRYRRSGDGPASGFQLLCLGADGQPGGRDEGADITLP